MSKKHKHKKWGRKYYLDTRTPEGGSIVICRSPALHLLHQNKPRSGATMEAFIGEMGINDKWVGEAVDVDFYFDGGKNTHQGTIVKAISRTNAMIEWR
jgi:hypothetical protein